MILFKIAWRNVWRNRRRSFLTALAIGLGLAALIFSDALNEGMKDQMIRAATDTLLGHAQIHARGFREDLDPAKTIPHPRKVLSLLRASEAVKAFSPRLVFHGMIASPEDTSAALVYAVEPDLERPLSRFDEHLVKGSYLGSSAKEVVIGVKLAKILKVSVGDRLVITTADVSGELVQELFRVRGIFATGMRELDGGLVLMRKKEAESLLGLPGAVHEVALLFEDLSRAGEFTAALRKFLPPGCEMLVWSELLPELHAALEMFDFSMMLMVLLLFCIVALAIMNTLFMALQERRHEFGILRALGTRPWQMGAMVVLEAACLAGLCILVGGLLGLFLNVVFAHIGIDYRGLEIAGVTIQESLKPLTHPRQFLLYPLLLFLFSVLVSLYPAVVAAKINPAEAMRRTL